MKKFLVSALIFFGLNFSAHAWWVNAGISVAPNRVTATVINSFGRPVICSGIAYGRTYSGAVMQSWLNSVVIFPGSYYNLYVFSNWEPFVNGWAQIDCQWY